jgi:hypothetical protein
MPAHNQESQKDQGKIKKGNPLKKKTGAAERAAGLRHF